MSETKYRKKLIEVALPLEAINRESAREKSIRHGHPSTLHLWWARRPLAAARAVLFAQLVDDPSAWPELFPTEAEQESERKRLFKIIEDMVPWEASNNEEIIGRARREIARSWARSHPSPKAERVLADDATPEVINDYLATELPPVHDPFAGGGTIPLEAQRLGLRAIASDLNPVAVLINKALIEIPPKFAGLPPVNPESRSGKKRKGKQGKLAGTERQWKGAQGLAEDVRYYGQWMRDEAFKRIGHLYPDVEVTASMAEGRADLEPYVGKKLTVIAWLWARTVASPDPAFAGIHVPLVSSFWLSKKKGKLTWLEPVVDGKSYRFEVRTGTPDDSDAVSAGTKLGRGANFRCVLSGTPIAPDYIKAEGVAGRMGIRLMAIVAEGRRARVYFEPTDAMETVAKRAKPTWMPEGDVPARLTGGTCYGYGLQTWGDLFTPRQLAALTTFSDLVTEASELAKTDAVNQELGNADEYRTAIAGYLAFVVSRYANYSSSLCVWSSHRKDELTKQVFLRQALPMTWDFSESNPFSSAGGTIKSCYSYVARAVERLAWPPVSSGSQAYQADAAASDVERSAVRIVSTDPPYFDNIGYADLSDFFYVWLRRTLSRAFARETATILTPKVPELIAASYRHGGREPAEAFFKDGMSKAIRGILDASAEGALVTIYYAFKQAESNSDGTASTGWEQFLQSLIDQGLAVRATWPVRSELTAALKRDVAALASCVVLACSRRDALATTVDRAEFRRRLQVELPTALRSLLHGNVAPVDLAQAAIGPGMNVYSRHHRVLDSDGSTLSVGAALRMINEALLYV